MMTRVDAEKTVKLMNEAFARADAFTTKLNRHSNEARVENILAWKYRQKLEDGGWVVKSVGTKFELDDTKG